MPRIHILGASGSGTSSLGQAIAASLGIRHVETDEIYWIKTDPPFRTPRPLQERLALLIDEAPAGEEWVLSGSALKWGAAVEPLFDLIVFLRLDPAVRLERIRQREIRRYGARILPGGDMAEASQAFLEWAESYDTAGPEQRSLAAHEAWLLTQTAPILRLNSMHPIDELMAHILRHPVFNAA